MKTVPMRSPYELLICIAGMVSGGFAYLKTNLDLLDASIFMTWEKIAGLLWGCLVALLTGMFAVAGKRISDWLIRKYIKKK